MLGLLVAFVGDLGTDPLFGVLQKLAALRYALQVLTSIGIEKLLYFGLGARLRATNCTTFDLRV